MSRVVTEWERQWTSEEFRADADELDARLDDLLDAALKRCEQVAVLNIPTEFLRAWAVGSELDESSVLDSPAMQRERVSLLWRALARKCRTGARADGTIEPRWRDLRPKNTREPRREGGRLDYFEMCRWLSQQTLADAFTTFGGSIRNVWQMLERPTLQPIVVRKALLAWMHGLPEIERERLYERESFAEMMKTLRNRWPDRGAGSAKRPVHYPEQALEREVESLLAPFLRSVVGRG
jgi:hypothetical protein